MSRFTKDDFDIAFGQVFSIVGTDDDDYKCKEFFKFLLTNTRDVVAQVINAGLSQKYSDYLYTIVEDMNAETLMTYIDNDNLSQDQNQQKTPFFRVKG